MFGPKSTAQEVVDAAPPLDSKVFLITVSAFSKLSFEITIPQKNQNTICL
jgi:hypothetical protein